MNGVERVLPTLPGFKESDLMLERNVWCSRVFQCFSPTRRESKACLRGASSQRRFSVASLSHVTTRKQQSMGDCSVNTWKHGTYSRESWFCRLMRAFFLFTNMNHSCIMASSSSLLLPETNTHTHKQLHFDNEPPAVFIYSTIFPTLQPFCLHKDKWCMLKLNRVQQDQAQSSKPHK